MSDSRRLVSPWKDSLFLQFALEDKALRIFFITRQMIIDFILPFYIVYITKLAKVFNKTNPEFAEGIVKKKKKSMGFKVKSLATSNNYYYIS